MQKEGATGDVVRVDRDGGVGTIRMNRPERLNACNREMGEGFLSAASALSSDPAVRWVVRTGSGKAFSAGGDVEMMPKFLAKRAARFEGRWNHRKRNGDEPADACCLPE